MDARREVIEIDLSAVATPSELHTLLAKALSFPDFYGCNWAAFWLGRHHRVSRDASAVATDRFR
jgi:hypothetical protein